MKLLRRANGYYYIYYDRQHRKSLKTRDRERATKIFNLEKEEVRKGKIIEFEKACRIRLSEFKKEYIEGSNELQKRELYVSPDTIDNDKLAFKKFIAVCGDIPIRQVKGRHIDDFKMKCLQLSHTKTYINILLRSLRAAFNTALGAGYISENAFIKKKGQAPVLFRLDEELPHYYSLEEIGALFEAIDDPEFLFAVEIYLYHGLRRSELLRLRAEHIDFANGFIKVHGTKSKRDRTVPIPEGYKETFMRKLKVDIGPLFPKWTSADTFSRLFRKYADKAKIKGRLHDIRHSYATHLRMNDVPLDEIQKLLGHADIKTTQIYAKVVDEKLKQSVNKLRFNTGGNS